MSHFVHSSGPAQSKLQRNSKIKHVEYQFNGYMNTGSNGRIDDFPKARPKIK